MYRYIELDHVDDLQVRDCVLPKDGSTLCEGEREVTEVCSPQQCPDWTPWTEWTPCTKSCGTGSKSRERECVVEKGAATGCVGEPRETASCNTQVVESNRRFFGAPFKFPNFTHFLKCVNLHCC